MNNKSKHYSIHLIKDTNEASEIMYFIRQSMIFYAHESGINLYNSKGNYILPAFNETRGDIINSILNNDVFVVKDSRNYIAHIRCISDYNSGKTMLTRFVIDNNYLNENIEMMLFFEIMQFLKVRGIKEIYIYIAINNKTMYSMLKKVGFRPYSINDGYPYPQACLIKELT